jgi:hypothetical protein
MMVSKRLLSLRFDGVEALVLALVFICAGAAPAS